MSTSLELKSKPIKVHVPVMKKRGTALRKSALLSGMRSLLAPSAGPLRVGDRAYVPSSAIATEVTVDFRYLQVHLTDGRVICVPWNWFPRLKRASFAQRQKCVLSRHGHSLHWPELDEDLCVANLLAGGDLKST